MSILESVDYDSALFEPLEGGAPEPEPGEDPPRRRRGRPLGSRNRTPTDGEAPAPRRGRPSGSAKERDLATALANPMVKLGAAVAFALPTTGAVVCQRAEVTSTALVKYAADKPRMLAALQKVSMVGPGSDIIETVAMCIIAAQLDRGAMDPSHPIARLTGIADIHSEITGHMKTAQAEQSFDFGAYGADLTPPPGWDPKMMSDPLNPAYSFSAKPGASARN